jgi:protein involved in polysaccharide export with SLBB domain
MRLFSLVAASLFMLAATLVAQTGPNSSKKPPVTVAVAVAVPVTGSPGQTVPVIRVGDVFEMRLSGMPQDLAAEFAVQYTVGQEGTVNVPLIGEVHVSGLTANQAEREVQAKLMTEKIFTKPTVVINIGGGVRFVSIGGGVRAPQRLQWSTDLTLRTAIENCGGLDDFGKKKGVRLIRDGKIIQKYDLRALEKDPSQDPKLMPGDQVYVPK